MCTCVRGWKTDNSNPDSKHNQVPVTCNEYIAALEVQLDDLARAAGIEYFSGQTASQVTRENMGIDPRYSRIEELIENSSLGTPEAKAIRESVSDEDVERVMKRYREIKKEN